MILSHLRFAFRHARRFKTYSAIKTAGLAIGFASSVAIFQFINSEFSYDGFFEQADNVYRINTVTQTERGAQIQAAAVPALAPTLMADMPEVAAATRLRHADDVVVDIAGTKFHETSVFYADSNFFKVLTFPLKSGDSRTVLKDINTAVITAELAKKYFGDQDPLNKTIQVNNIVLEIRGVTQAAVKSHLDFDILISFESFTPPKGAPRGATTASWAWTSFPTYLRVRNGSDVKALEAKLPAFIRKYRTPEDALIVSYQLQPIEQVYLHSRDILERDGIVAKGDYQYTIALGAIAVVIMLITCFSFANLSAALAIFRVRETGIKRSLGSTRKHIFSLLVIESLGHTTFSFLLAMAILHVGIILSGNTLNMDWPLTATTHLNSLPVYALMIVIIGIAGGIYPAIFLSGLKPQLAIKGQIRDDRPGKIGLPLKKMVIVFQFFVTTVLIATSLCFQRQTNFIQSKNLGYNRDNVLVLHVPDNDMRNLFTSFRSTLSRKPHVLGVSASRDLFDGQQGLTDVLEIGAEYSGHPINMFRMYPNFVETMGINLIQGRSFTEPLHDSTAFILNESAVKMLGWKNEDAIGKRIHSYFQTGDVIGVVQDFHFASLHSAIAPLIMLVPKTKVEFLYVRIAAGHLDETLHDLESDWKAIAPHLPFHYLFLDQHIGEMYQQDRRLARLAFVFCGLSIVLASLGLYGIISLMAEKRTKEIGIRKVLGASVSKIVGLLTRQFFMLVLIAGTMAAPVSYYLLHRWLSNFAYRIDVPVDILMVSIIASLMVAGFAVGIRSLKAATASPVKSIRSE